MLLSHSCTAKRCERLLSLISTLRALAMIGLARMFAATYHKPSPRSVHWRRIFLTAVSALGLKALIFDV